MDLCSLLKQGSKLMDSECGPGHSECGPGVEKDHQCHSGGEKNRMIRKATIVTVTPGVLISYLLHKKITTKLLKTTFFY